MILGEVEEILEVVDAKNFKAFAEPLFQQLSRSMFSPHFQVSFLCFTYSSHFFEQAAELHW